MFSEPEQSFGLWQKEKDFLAREKEKQPELFLRPPLIDDAAVLQSVGIDPVVFGTRQLGHIKLFPEDFIVEEVGKDKTLHTVDDLDASGFHAAPGEDARTVWVDAVKMGIDTIEVVNELSRRLGIEKKQIGFAGIKDKYALTSQPLSIRGSNGESCRSIRASNFFLKNILAGKGALQPGDLSGNRFTILVRTPEALDSATMEERLKDIKEQGFWNFFYLQRFGVPRLASHKLGLLILQGKYEDAVRVFLSVSSVRELPYFRMFRERVVSRWGRWEDMLQMLDALPYSFRNEQIVVKYLITHPSDFNGALNQLPEQVKLWVYAYASYCFNKVLSSFIKKGDEVPFELPLALSSDPRAKEYYGAFFEAHGIQPPFPALKPFPYVQKLGKNIETLKKFTLYGTKIVPQGVVTDFFLEKASYATTFLSHLFVLSSGQPVPHGISIEEIDAKVVLGTGTIGPLKTGKFKELFEMRKETDILKAETEESVQG